MKLDEECSGIGCDGCNEYQLLCRLDYTTKIEELIAIISDNQWNSFNIANNQLVVEDANICPECCNTPNEGHKEECRIGQVLTNEATP